ncbi:hypothetical protein [Chryseobacterium taklimakanense]|uniref:hypothetical protein n=1 Tax=Chryseobacterium taklimakanense TaxID=536441 RepID=UPI0023F98CB2|nr:hypothetical protein [Chryseobacterium taklimakanense]
MFVENLLFYNKRRRRDKFVAVRLTVIMVSIVDAKRWCTGDLTMMKTCRTYGAPLSALILFATNLMRLQRN